MKNLFTPVKCYSNADINKQVILSDNKGKLTRRVGPLGPARGSVPPGLGIYMWKSINSGKIYIFLKHKLSFLL